MPLVPITVELISHTPDPERHIELCGREAYGSAPSPDIEGTRSWIRKRIAGWEHDVLEHASATIRVQGSRVYSHEMVRHRLASYTQSSMRFSEAAAKDYILPPEVKEEDRAEWDYDQALIQEYYRKWRTDKGYPRQTAHYFLPLATATSMMETLNFRSWRHVITMRAEAPAQPEMRAITKEIWVALLAIAPSVFEDLAKELEKRGWL